MLHGQSIDWIVHAASGAMFIADAQEKIVVA